jgi:hypothetical protein
LLIVVTFQDSLEQSKIKSMQQVTREMLFEITQQQDAVFVACTVASSFEGEAPILTMYLQLCDGQSGLQRRIQAEAQALHPEHWINLVGAVVPIGEALYMPNAQNDRTVTEALAWLTQLAEGTGISVQELQTHF